MTNTAHIIEKYLPAYKGTINQIIGSGSNRIYLRLKEDGTNKSLIAVYGTSVEENKAFIYLAHHFVSKGLPMPRILSELSKDGHFYLQEDLGELSLFDALSKGRACGGIYSQEEEKLLHQTIALLPAIQFEGIIDLDTSRCYPQAYFDQTSVMFDLNYFKYCFLKAAISDFNEVKLEHDFTNFTKDLLNDTEQVFLYRDFQARNVMLPTENTPYYIDFQGGRVGPLYYDLASFLWQAAARYPQTLRNKLIDTYLSKAKNYINIDRDYFNERLQLFVLFRMLQVLGAYGFRGNFERKEHFLKSIPHAINSLHKLIDVNFYLFSSYPYLRSLLEELCAQYLNKKEDIKREHLVVRIFSFSYKEGIPEDISDNGGGYVFDCRSIHNPGRYAEYKQLTGLDEPVIHFLETDGEITTFLNNIYKLADTHVSRYLERGFTDLMFSFGCTGGQHRSVYSAEHLAEHLHKKFGIEIDLYHREQNIHRIIR